jgi:hypothetical protein
MSPTAAAGGPALPRSTVLIPGPLPDRLRCQSRGRDFDLLLGRDREELDKVATDLSLRHLKAQALAFDAVASTPIALSSTPAAIVATPPAPSCFGYLGEQSAAQKRSCRGASSPRHEPGRRGLHPFPAGQPSRGKRAGFFARSIAGDRGRQSNHVYGAAKAASPCSSRGFATGCLLPA